MDKLFSCNKIPIITATIVGDNGMRVLMAVNEIIIEKTGFYAVEYLIKINGQKITSINCDGIMIST